MMPACFVQVGSLASLGLACVALLGLFGCGGDDESGPGVEVAAPDAEAPSAQATLVRTQPVEHGVYDRRAYVVYGVAQPYKQYRVGFERPGLVERVAVQEGERVSAGDRLAQLDMAAARLARREAELALEQAEADRKRIHQAQDSFTASQMEEAQRTRDRARVALEQAELTLERSVCTAPATLRDCAVVERLHVEPGEVVAAGQPLMTLVDETRLRVSVRVPGRIVTELEGSERVADVELRDAGVKATEVPLTRISAVADAVGQYTVELELANDEGRIRAGMIAEVRLALSARHDVTVLPMTAVTRQGDEYVAWFAARISDDALATVDTADEDNAQATLPVRFQAVRWSVPVAETELWHNDLIVPRAAPHDRLILDGYQSLLERQPIRLESE